MAMLLIGGIVGGTGRIALTVAAIVLLLLAVAYVGLQVWYLNRARRARALGPPAATRARAGLADPRHHREAQGCRIIAAP